MYFNRAVAATLQTKDAKKHLNFAHMDYTESICRHVSSELTPREQGVLLLKVYNKKLPSEFVAVLDSPVDDSATEIQPSRKWRKKIQHSYSAREEPVLASMHHAWASSCCDTLLGVCGQ